MGQRKTDWIIPEWNSETELPDEVKGVMYYLYTEDQNRNGERIYKYDDFFDLDLSFVLKRRNYYKKAVILLRRDKIQKLRSKIKE